MSSNFGQKIKISVFGQSHSTGIGVVIDGLPAGEEINIDEVLAFMSRRAPGKNKYSTQRKESDTPEILSGLINNKTCGAPLCAIIRNSDTRSGDYNNLKVSPRPSHADFPAYVKYGGFNDIRGGGHFSGRLTAPICFAGAVCKQILEKKGIFIGSHVYSVGDVYDTPLDAVDISNEQLADIAKREFPIISDEKREKMLKEIADAAQNGDSVGGTVECCITGVPTGIGEPMFDGLENRIAACVFAIPAVRGIEFGAGFAASEMKGSEHNDEYYYSNTGEVKTKTNNHGGIIGGISTGMPIIFRTAFKPTPSIASEQNSVNLEDKTNTKLQIKGRHDPCIVMRAVPCVEAAAAIAITDLL